MYVCVCGACTLAYAYVHGTHLDYFRAEAQHQIVALFEFHAFRVPLPATHYSHPKKHSPVRRQLQIPLNMPDRST